MTATTALGRSLLCGFIRAYQYVISPLFAGCCRFHPTCSHYAIEAISKHGALRGFWLSVCRVLRCNPWGGAGLDPVPDLPNNSLPRPRERNRARHARHYHA